MPPPLPPGLSFPIPLSPPLLFLLPETSDLIPPFRQLLSPLLLLPPIPLYHSLSHERTLRSSVAKTRKDGLSSLSFPRRTFAPSYSAWVPYMEGKLLVRHPGVQSYIAVCVCGQKLCTRNEIKEKNLSLHKKAGKKGTARKLSHPLLLLWKRELARDSGYRLMDYAQISSLPTGAGGTRRRFARIRKEGGKRKGEKREDTLFSYSVLPSEP